MTGNEDLGGGLQALFKLENGFTPVQPREWAGAAGSSEGRRLWACRPLTRRSHSADGITRLSITWPREVWHKAQSVDWSLCTEWTKWQDFGDFFRLDNTVKFATDLGG